MTLPPPIGDTPVAKVIPDGTTWTDESGHTWTAHGSLLLADDAIRTVRQTLIEYLEDEFPSWNWYANPPDNLKAPAGILNPSDPYIAPYTQGGPGSTVWGFELVILTQRLMPDEALRRLEFAFTAISRSLLLYDGAELTRWTEFGDIGTTTYADRDYMTGTLSIIVVVKEGI